MHESLTLATAALYTSEPLFRRSGRISFLEKRGGNCAPQYVKTENPGAELDLVAEMSFVLSTNHDFAGFHHNMKRKQ